MGRHIRNRGNEGGESGSDKKEIDRFICSLNFIPAEADFDTTVLTVTFPADEAESSLVLSVPAPILVVNDELNEAPEQFFIVHMELEDAINTALVEEQRTVATCAIQDNDGK